MSGNGLQRLWFVPLLALVGLGVASAAAVPIAEAVKNRDRAAVAALLRQHVDVNVPLADGTTALHWAAQFNDLETADLLLRAGADVNATNRYHATPLWIACANGSADVVARLLKAGAPPNGSALGGEAPLFAAARAGSLNAVQELLVHGADVNARDANRGQTALMAAVGDEPHLDVARVLLENRADVNIRSKGGFTALLFAVRQGDLASTRLLLEAGANVNDKAPGGGTVLLMAINNGHYDLSTMLLDTGADPTAADRSGFSPLHVVVRRRAGRTEQSQTGNTDDATLALIKALVAHGTDPNIQTPKVRRPPSLAPSARPKVDFVETGGVTPFWIAANMIDLDAMRLLVANGADPTLPSMEKTTPLMVAAGLGYGTIGGLSRKADSDLKVLEAIKLLLAWGNDINAVNENGQTAVHGAVYAAAAPVLQFLVEHGARIDQKDTLGRPPIVVADDNRTDKYRSNQDLNPGRVESTWTLLRGLSGASVVK